MTNDLVMDHNLGGNERPVDDRDFLVATVQAPVDHPPVFMQNLSPLNIFTQLKQPACGAHAGNYLKMYEKFVELGQPQVTQTFSPRFLWVEIKAIDGFPLEDGTNMRSIFKALQTKGTCDVSLCTNDSWLSVQAYADPAVATSAARANAANNTIKSYAFLPTVFTFDDLKRAIYQNGCVVICMRVNDQMWTSPSGVVSWQEGDVLPMRPPTASHPRQSGHFVVLHSYDENFIYFANSWGLQWGRYGHGYFGPNYMSEVTEAGIALDLPVDLVNQLKKLAAPKFKKDDPVRVIKAVNVRSTPDTTGRVMSEQPAGVTGTIVNGPVINHGYIWWEVNYDSANGGWSIENNLALVIPQRAVVVTPAPEEVGYYPGPNWVQRLLAWFTKK